MEVRVLLKFNLVLVFDILNPGDLIIFLLPFGGLRSNILSVTEQCECNRENQAFNLANHYNN